jgi:rhodanese-related sulfurtransferase/ABC-type phosphate/phosphonate transport system substrate-binding protein
MSVSSKWGMTLLMVAAAAALPAWAQYKVLINPGDQGEQSRFAVYRKWEAGFEQALAHERVGPYSVQQSGDATADLRLTRTRLVDVFLAPAHVIGSAVRFGYTPVLGLEGKVQSVLVTLKDSAITNLAQAKGKRLGLPMQDSVVTYLLRGELNAENTTIKQHFSAQYETRYQDALLPCLQLQRCDVVAVERAVFDRWTAAGQPVKVVAESQTAPAMAVALKDGSKPGVAALRAALSEAMAGPLAADGQKLVALNASDFDYVSTLGYFTPRTLSGVQVVLAAEVAQRMQAGALYIDTRTEPEFKAGHAHSALWVPYVEKSAKEPDYKATEDQFDLTKLPANKAAALVFACNGAECWKSYKASIAARAAGYSQVMWFRGGFPEWRAAGLKVDASP